MSSCSFRSLKTSNISKREIAFMQTLPGKKNWKSKQELEIASLYEKQDLLHPLVTLYQNIFGNDPVWKEGAYCSREGWSKLIPLHEYREMKKAVETPLCECGAKLKPCHPTGKVEEKIKSLLHNPNGFLFLLIKNQMPIGFSWGIIGNLSSCCVRIMSTRYNGREKEGFFDLQKLKNTLRDKIGPEENLLYLEEVAVSHEERNIETGMLIIEAALSAGCGKDVKQSLYWTSPQASIYVFGLCVGYFSCMKAKDGYEYLWCDDLPKATMLLRTNPPFRFAHLCAKKLREKKS